MFRSFNLYFALCYIRILLFYCFFSVYESVTTQFHVILSATNHPLCFVFVIAFKFSLENDSVTWSYWSFFCTLQHFLWIGYTLQLHNSILMTEKNPLNKLRPISCESVLSHVFFMFYFDDCDVFFYQFEQWSGRH